MIKGTMIAAVVAAFTLAGTGTAAADIGTPTVNVDTAKVAQSLNAALGGGNTVGYAYAITENGQLAKTGGGGQGAAGREHRLHPEHPHRHHERDEERGRRGGAQGH